MKNSGNGFITSTQMVSIIVGTIIGTELLYMPRYMVEYAEQDAWIFAASGAIYPLYVVFIASFLCSKFPNDNILNLSKKFFGKIFGSILNILFLIQLLFYTTIRCSQFSSLIRVYIVYFLTPQLVIGITVLATAYASSRGLRAFSRVNETVLFITLPIMLAPLGALPFGSIKNIMPVFSTDLPHIFIDTIRGFNNYFGIEIILLFYPFFKDKPKFKKAGIISVVICSGIITFVTFITIYYFGIDIIPKFLWPVMGTIKALNLRAIRNFSFIFMFFWVITVLQSIMNHYFSVSFILSDFFKKANISSLPVYIIPAVYYISLQYGNEVMSRSVLVRIVPVFTIFNIVFISLIALLAYIKKGKADENS